MAITSPLVPAPKIAGLSIHFLVVGGGIAGLSCAIALSRVGHRVTVLERHSDVSQGSGGCRTPPNLSKVLAHWGLEEDLLRFGLRSEGIDLNLFDTGEKLGRHSWDKEMLRETRGEFIFSRYVDLRRLLYDVALSCGVTIRMGVEVTEIDPTARRVKLAVGEALTADVVIGADGEFGMSRKIVLDALSEENGAESEPMHRFNCYSSVISRDVILQDPEIAPMLSQEFKGMFAWFGNQSAALAIPLNVGRTDMALFIYTPKDGNEGTWEMEAPASGLIAAASTAEPRIQKLAKLGTTPPNCLPVIEYPELEEWVHESGRFLVVGGAAHPMPAGGIQDVAMSLEDGAVLAKLFSHLRTEDQIETLLYAFQDLRQPHVEKIKNKEMGDINFMTIPPGEIQQGRDASMREKRDAGMDVLAQTDSGDEIREWTEIKDVFGYDAEDDADNWWMEWGLLRERARGTDIAFGFVEPVAIRQGRMSISEAAVGA